MTEREFLEKIIRQMGRCFLCEPSKYCFSCPIESEACMPVYAMESAKARLRELDIEDKLLLAIDIPISNGGVCRGWASCDECPIKDTVYPLGCPNWAVFEEAVKLKQKLLLSRKERLLRTIIRQRGACASRDFISINCGECPISNGGHTCSFSNETRVLMITAALKNLSYDTLELDLTNLTPLGEIERGIRCGVCKMKFAEGCYCGS